MNEDLWKNHVFALLMPDAVRRGQAGGVLQRLADSHFIPVAGRIVRLTPDMLDRTFGAVRADLEEAYHFRMLDLVFSLGPCLALVLRSEGEEPEMYTRIRILKGTTDPTKAPPGTLRSDFKGINTVMGIIHIADSASTSEQEWTRLTGYDLSREVFTSSSSELSDKTFELAQILDVSNNETRNFPETLYSHRNRVLVSIWDQLNDRTRQEATKAILDRSLAQRDVGSSLTRGLSEYHPARKLLSCEWTVGSTQLELEDLRGQLAALGLPQDDWEAAVLVTSGKFRQPLGSIIGSVGFND